VTTSTDKDIILHHIDKIYDNLSQTTQTTNRIKLLEVILSLIIIALSFSLVSADQQVSLFGLTLTVPLWLFILGCTWIIGVLFIFFQFLDEKRDILSKKVVELYKAVGYSYNCMSNYLPNIIASMLIDSFFKYGFFKRARFRIIIILLQSYAIAFFIVFVALFAQIIAYYKILSLVGWSWLVIVSLSLQFIFTVPYLITMYKATPPTEINI
jgi:hypothetical protein